MLVQVGLGQRRAARGRGDDARRSSSRSWPAAARGSRPARRSQPTALAVTGITIQSAAAQRRDGQAAEAGRMVQGDRVVAGPQPPQRPGDEGGVGGPSPPVRRPAAGSRGTNRAPQRRGWGRPPAASRSPARIASRSAASSSAWPRSQRVGIAWASQSTARVRRGASEPRRNVGRCDRLATPSLWLAMARMTVTGSSPTVWACTAIAAPRAVGLVKPLASGRIDAA